MGGEIHAALQRGSLTSTAASNRLELAGNAASESAPLSYFELSGTQCFSHSGVWLCKCCSLDASCMCPACWLTVDSTEAGRSQLWLARANWAFNNNQHAVNSNAQARLPGKRSICINCEITFRADIIIQVIESIIQRVYK